jgi:Dockerin type I domain
MAGVYSTDSAGNFSPAVAGQMGVLIGDVNASGLVDSDDVFLVRQQTGQTVSASNFREDVNGSGRLDAQDITITRQLNFASLPQLVSRQKLADGIAARRKRAFMSGSCLTRWRPSSHKLR